MKSLLTYIVSITFIGLLGGLLWSCDKWDLPTKKTKRECVKPSGNITAGVQGRKVDFTITNTTGTIDKVSWDFGAGSATGTTSTNSLTATFSYAAQGTYTVKASLTNSCDQETILTTTVVIADPVEPTVSLQAPTNPSINAATAGMTVTSTGNAAITFYGICYSRVDSTPAKGKSNTSVVEKTGPTAINIPASFTIANLQANTLYFVSSFATNSAGKTGYSRPVQTFVTGSLPSINVTGATNVGINNGTVNFVVTNSGNPAAIEYGVCYSSTNNVPEVGGANSMTKQVANPPVNTNTTVELTNLTANTTYFYRIYAKLPSGEIIYSSTQSTTTKTDTLAQDLIASVSFNDRSLLDISGYNNHVKLVGTSFTTDHNGKANSAVMLNGSGDYFYMPESSSLNPEALTISIWIKPAAKPTGPLSRMQIYNKARFSDGLPQTYSSLMRLEGEGDVGPRLTFMTNIKQGSNCQGGVGWKDLDFTAPVNLNTWYHLVFTYSGRSARMYFNNTLVFSTDNLPADKIDYCPGGELKFGAQYQSLPWYFNGAMDDIRIYKRALSASEVETLFKQ